MLINLVEAIKLNMQVKTPAIKTSNEKIEIVLKYKGVYTLDDFTRIYKTKDPLKNFRNDYLAYMGEYGFKAKPIELPLWKPKTYIG